MSHALGQGVLVLGGGAAARLQMGGRLGLSLAAGGPRCYASGVPLPSAVPRPSVVPMGSRWML
jgi:hypothetical protein